jgi:hypothetical protein
MQKLFRYLKIKFWYLLLFFLPNIIIFLFNIAGYGIELYYIPFFVLEFSLITLIVSLYPNKKTSYFIGLLFSIIIILTLIGRLFLFGHPFVLLKNLAFVSFIPFKWYHIFLVIYVFLIPYFFNIIIFKKLKPYNQKTKFVIGISIIIFMTFFDLINSSIFTKGEFFKLLRYNVQGCYTSEYFFVKNYSIERKKTIKSLAYTIIKQDSSPKIFLIIIESLPFYNSVQNKILLELTTNNLSNKYTVTYDSIPFYGHTTTAEINELVNENEEFYNYIDPKKNYKTALPNIKKKQGYKTYAAHSFYISMFRRDLWWKNLGFDNTYGKENIPHRSIDINKENSFQGLNDEITFNYLVEKSKRNKSKGFYYMLSVNTHFPFTITNKKEVLYKYKSIINNLPSENLKMSFIRFYQQIDYISKTIAKEKIDLVIIRGDHKPPFLNESEAKLINFRQVPEIIIRRND